MEVTSESEIEYWCIVANIKRQIPYGEGGLETRVGTKQFKGGAKVYIVGAHLGTCDSLLVIGQNKHTGRFIQSVVRVTTVENMRVKKLYGKSATKLRSFGDRQGAQMITTKNEAEELVALIPLWCAD